MTLIYVYPYRASRTENTAIRMSHEPSTKSASLVSISNPIYARTAHKVLTADLEKGMRKQEVNRTMKIINRRIVAS